MEAKRCVDTSDAIIFEQALLLTQGFARIASYEPMLRHHAKIKNKSMTGCQTNSQRTYSLENTMIVISLSFAYYAVLCQKVI